MLINSTHIQKLCELCSVTESTNVNNGSNFSSSREHSASDAHHVRNQLWETALCVPQFITVLAAKLCHFGGSEP